MREGAGPGGVAWDKVLEGFREELAEIGVPEAEARIEAERRLARTRRRLDWLRGQYEALRTAYERTGDYYCAAMDAHPEIDWDAPDAPDIPPPPAQRVADLLLAGIEAAARHDRWPRHLHFSNI